MLWRCVLVGLVVLGAPLAAVAQWGIQDAHTTADLRGIDSLGKGVAWASGSHGTVLRTEDAGFVWQLCTVPPGAEALDFRGIQAFDHNTAIVMSSGKGDLSRLYKTTDGCQSWTLVATNPDKEGFWDAVWFEPNGKALFILGDPVQGAFRLFSSQVDERKMQFGKLESNWNGHPITASPGESAFAASNSLFAYSVGDGTFSFITGGARSEIIREEHGLDSKKGMFSEWSRNALPFLAGDSSGAFSIAATDYDEKRKQKVVVVVGGNYKQPDLHVKTAAYSFDWGYHFSTADTPPHGYRSAVGYDKAHNAWITVGPNGTDISTDDGRNWRALRPGPGDAPEADQHWNALSLPFVVGPHGRIGVLRPEALAGATK